VTTAPLASSRKIFVTPDEAPDVRAALARDHPQGEGRRRAQSSGGMTTSGPYTDPSVTMRLQLPGCPARASPGSGAAAASRNISGRDIKPEDIRAMSALRMRRIVHRASQAAARVGDHMITQLEFGPRRDHHQEMIYVATPRESRPQAAARNALRPHWADGESFGASVPAFVTPEFVRSEIARGRAIIPCNINHGELEPMHHRRATSSPRSTPISATPAVTSSVEEEVDKMVWAIRWGADTVMDLSTGRNIPPPPANGFCATRRFRSATGPIYQALEKCDGDPVKLTWELYKDTLIEQCEQGRRLLHHPRRRAACPISTSPPTASPASSLRGGSIMAKWCLAHHKESFLYTHFEEICDLMRKYDVSFSLGRRPPSRLDRGCQRPRAIRRTGNARRAHADCLEKRLPG